MPLIHETYKSTEAEMMGHLPVQWAKKITVVRVRDGVTGLYVDSWKRPTQHGNLQHARTTLIEALAELKSETTPPTEIMKEILTNEQWGMGLPLHMVDFGVAEETVVAHYKMITGENNCK